MTEGSSEAMILVRGAIDVASAVGVVLFRAGYQVVLLEVERVPVSRRGMAFADAIDDQTALVDGVAAFGPSCRGS